jgi:hypothetical protein
MQLTREQINEAKNFPTEKIKAKSKAIKDTLSGIEATKMESDSRKPGMPAGLAKEVATKVTGPIASLRKKLKETVDDKKATDDLKSNLASKKALERMEKEAQKIKDTSVRMNRKVADALSKAKVNRVNTDVAQRKARTKYQEGQKKAEKERNFMANKYAAESVDFKKRVKSYLSLNEMAMKHFGPEAEKKYDKEELKGIFDKASVDQLANNYVKNARADGMDDTKIAQGLGATLRGMEDKDKVAKVKAAVKAKLDLVGNKPKPKKETGKQETKQETKQEKSSKPGFLGKK